MNDVAHLADRVVLQEQQVHFVDQSCHMCIILQRSSFQLAASQYELLVELEHLILRRHDILNGTAGTAISLIHHHLLLLGELLLHCIRIGLPHLF